MADHAARKPVESKVSMATLGAFMSSSLVATLNAWIGDDQLLGSMPGWLQTVAIAFGPTAVTFLSGYFAKHTPRNEEDGTVGTKSL